MVVFDNTVLSLLLHPEADVPDDPANGKPVEQARDRIQHLVEQLQAAGTRIAVPAPVLAEFLTFGNAEYLTEINQSMWFEIAPFDQRAAIEAAVAIRRAVSAGLGKKLGLSDTWQKIKVDRQLIAIAKVIEATAVYSTDAGVLTLAKESGLEAVHVADLPLPPTDPQQALPLDALISGDVPATAPEQPSSQSPGDGSPKEAPPAPGLPSGPLDGQAPLPPDSSQHVVPPPPSKK